MINSLYFLENLSRVNMNIKIKRIVASIMVFVFMAASFMVALPAEAKTKVKGHTRKNGTYVQPHYRSDKNSKKSDNWSTKGNVNPITGKKGTKR